MRAVATGLAVLFSFAGVAQAQVDYGPSCSGFTEHTVLQEATDLGQGLVGQEISQFYGNFRRYGWMVADCATGEELVVEVLRYENKADAELDESAEDALFASQKKVIRGNLDILRSGLGAGGSTLVQIRDLAENLGMETSGSRIAPDHCGCALYYAELAGNREIVQ